MLAILMTYITCIYICYASCDINDTINFGSVNGNTYHMIDELPRISSKQILECNQQVIASNTNVPIYKTDNIVACDTNDNHDIVQIHPASNIQSTSNNTETYNQTYSGTYIITAYTWTGNTMANGEYPYVGCAASCDFPIGTTLYIEGIGTYVVNDICPTSGVIDLYMNTYDECIQFGRKNANVYVII